MTRRKIRLTWANRIRLMRRLGMLDGEIVIEMLRHAEEEETRITEAFRQQHKKDAEELRSLMKWRTKVSI